MNCGCCKDLGCFAPGQTIDFGFKNPCSGGGGGGGPHLSTFTFQIWTNGTWYEIQEQFAHNDQIVLPMTFNENSVTEIKIKLPDCMVDEGVHYATTPDGACCFRVNGIVPTCL